MKQEKTVLKNGATIVGIKMPNAKSVVINFGFRVGSRDEDPKYAGISHFLEHMVFKGSAKRPSAAAIAKEADRIGAKYNAFTGKEYTCFYIQTTLENFDLGLDLIGDMVTRPHLKQAEINKEVGTIVEEIKMYEDNPMEIIFDKSEETLFGSKNPLGREIVGTTRSVRNINARVMRSYFEQYYCGQNAVLVITGNLPSNYADKATAYLNRFQKGASNERLANNKYRQTVRLIEKKTEQAHLGICLPAFSVANEKKYAAEIIATALGGYMSARLSNEIREKRGWAYRILALNNLGQDSGFLGIFGGIKKDKIYDAVELTKKEMIKFRDKFNEEEIKRAKSHLLGSATLNYEDPEKRAYHTVIQYLINSSPETPEELIKKIQSVTNQELKEVAKELLNPDNFALTVIGPYKNKKKFAKILNQ